MAGEAREDRGRGNPLSDTERACRHYNISEEEYLSDPDSYPLPKRGTGLTSGNSIVSGLGIVGLVLAVSGVIGLAIKKNR